MIGTSDEDVQLANKLVDPAAENNKQPILNVLTQILPDDNPSYMVLELASGTGQHITYFAEHFPLIQFQPSDIEPQYLQSIRAHIREYEINAFTQNCLQPITIDLRAPPTPHKQVDCVYTANLTQIVPLEITRNLFSFAEKILRKNGFLIIYGPFAKDGHITPESNRKFNEYLQKHDERWGLKDINELTSLATKHQLQLRQIFDMPANNKILWFIKID
ncbi:unnamed protein product [Didymodactylos carnosus]|uniref:Uncharacterized protein n=1 Tax=Didymodactylos carnosus TaxID=1234261 RepID=A0A814FRZ7_9BILA|nr:unnamed protein product [Didymodactylos carnosus]CAF1143151.1 unnamed protein product [Didymodactylos carnosus]CAF3758206.1 unnamed protein product [Didymodactylos carnosus]CAF3941336.1 unnamed protein product [Didymodactylos carnosus]